MTMKKMAIIGLFTNIVMVQMQYHSLAPMYYRGAAAAIVVYDITRKVNTCSG